MSELLNKVSNSVHRSNAIAKKHNVILNKTKLPTTTVSVKPNQFRFSTWRTAVLVEKTADERIELKAAIHCHSDR